MKKTIKVCEVERSYGNEDWPPVDPAGFLRWFQDKIETVPVEYRDTLAISISAHAYYDSGTAEIIIEYTRDETPEEIDAREYEAQRQASNKEAQERKTLAALKAKYESGT